MRERQQTENTMILLCYSETGPDSRTADRSYHYSQDDLQHWRVRG